MIAHRIETTVEQDGTLVLSDLPFQAGEKVEVIVISQTVEHASSNGNSYPLRGLPVKYTDPTEPVAVDDWDALR